MDESQKTEKVLSALEVENMPGVNTCLLAELALNSSYKPKGVISSWRGKPG